MVTIALDAMGGDNSPLCNIDGAIRALEKNGNISVILLGPESVLKPILQEKQYPADRLQTVDAPEVISTEESPVQAVQKKKNSSIVQGIALVREQKADAFVSAGSSGAVLAAGQLKLGRIRGVLRPPLGTVIPNAKGISFFLDMGANVDAKPEWLYQFARMGSIYMEKVLGVENPTVRLLNLGLEEEKGNTLTKEAAALLREDPSINYRGYIESREIPYGGTDVIVADAFTGNAVIKMFEGVSGMLLQTIREVLHTNMKTKLGGLLIRKELKEKMKTFDAKEYGGAPLLGVKGAVFKCHGNATEKEIANTLLQAETFVVSGVNERIAKAFEKV